MLLQLLQEASNLSIPQVKKAIQKDKRAAQILKKNLKLADIENPEAFLSTVKYYIFNNENVKNFVALRNNVRDLDIPEFNKWRSLRVADLDDENLKWFADFVDMLFKEHTSVERGTMSPDLKRELADWFNSNGRYFNLPTWAQRELMALPHLRSDKRVLVYRGVLFKEYDLKTSKRYDGTMEIGNGLKFLKSIRDDSRTVDLEWDRPSSWTTSKQIASQFAKYGPASSNFAATLNWLERSMSKQAIDGALGFIISTFVNPEDVLIDTSRLRTGIGSQHGDEGELILKPGKYTARIVKKFTVDGEVDPDAVESHDTSKLEKALDASHVHSQKMSASDEHADLLKTENVYNVYDATQLILDMTRFRKLALDSTTTSLMHEYDKLVDFYKEHLHDLKDDDIRADSLVGKDDLRLSAGNLQKFLNVMRGSIKHSKFVDSPSRKGSTHELSAEEYRATIVPPDLKQLENDLLVRGRVDDRSTLKYLESIAKAAGVTIPGTRFYMLGTAKQWPVINEIFSKVIDNLGLSPSDDPKENIKRTLNLLKKAYRNFKLIKTIKYAKEALQGNTNEDN